MNWPVAPGTKISGMKAMMLVPTAYSTGTTISVTPSLHRLAYRQALLAFRVDVLADDDRVVDHDAQRQDEGEHRDHVQRDIDLRQDR